MAALKKEEEAKKSGSDSVKNPNESYTGGAVSGMAVENPDMSIFANKR